MIQADDITIPPAVAAAAAAAPAVPATPDVGGLIKSGAAALTDTVTKGAAAVVPVLGFQF